MRTGLTIIPMPGAGERPVRLVAQYLGKTEPLPYRLIAYPVREGFRTPLTFASREELARRLSAILPLFNGRLLELANEFSPQIVFAENVELSDAQWAEFWEE